MLATPVILRYPDRLSLHHLIPLTLPSSYSHKTLPHARFEGTDIDRTDSQREAMTVAIVSITSVIFFTLWSLHCTG